MYSGGAETREAIRSDSLPVVPVVERTAYRHDLGDRLMESVAVLSLLPSPVWN